MSQIPRVFVPLWRKKCVNYLLSIMTILEASLCVYYITINLAVYDCLRSTEALSLHTNCLYNNQPSLLRLCPLHTNCLYNNQPSLSKLPLYPAFCPLCTNCLYNNQPSLLRLCPLRTNCLYNNQPSLLRLCPLRTNCLYNNQPSLLRLCPLHIITSLLY